MPEYNAPGGSGDSSPLTTKGDLYTFDTGNTRLPVGTDGHVLLAASGETTGLKWGPVSGAGNTLDAAYDQGGAGSGRTINAEAGAVTIAASSSASNTALSVVHDKTDQIALSVENTATNAAATAVNIQTANLVNADTPLLNVSAGTSGSASEVFKVTGGGITATNSAGSPAIVAQSANTAQNAIMSFTTNSLTSNIQQTPTGVFTLTGNTDIVVAAGGANQAVDLQPGANSVAKVSQGLGFCVGTVPSSSIATFSASIGEGHTTVTERSLVVGHSNSATNHSLAVGRDVFASINSVAVGESTSTANYTNGATIALNNGTSTGATFSPNTLVMDAGNNAPAGAVALVPVPGGPGNIYSDAGTFFSGSADYAEMFEWDDGNTSNSDRRGFFVSLVNGDKIEVGNSDVIGVISARPVVVGDANELTWQGKYDTDDFGGLQYDMVDGKPLPRLSANFNPTQEYIGRRHRKEWAAVGLVGKLYVRSAQALTAGTRCSSNSSGYAVSGSDFRILRVLRQPTASKHGLIEILMK